MNLFSKEYRVILGASTFALLSVAGSSAFLWDASEKRAAAAQELQKRNKEFDRLRTGSPAPTEESRRQLEQQEKAASASADKLRTALTALNIPLEKIQPQEFQTSLNTKTQNFAAKAAKNKVAVPHGLRESDPFSMDFDDFIKKVPSEDRAPAVNRQLTAADRLLNTLLDSKPMALNSFKIDRTEETKEPIKETKTDPKSGKPGQSTPPPRVLSSLGFDLKFTASPDSFRDFLNALARDKQAFFVARRVKVTTLSKDGVPMLAPSKTAVTAPAEPVLTGQLSPTGQLSATGLPSPTAQPVAPSGAQYILGDEHIEVEMRVELLTTLPPPEAPVASSGEKSSKSASKEGAKKP
jgi:hypothetical protein